MTPAAPLAALLVVVLALGLRPRAARSTVDVRSPSAGHVRTSTRLPERVVVAVRRRQARRLGSPPEIVAEWCSDLARAIRSGDALRLALERTVPSNEVLRLATAPIRLGLERGRTVAEVADDADDAIAVQADAGRGHLTLAVSVLAVCGRTGGSAAAPLDRVAAALRGRAADDQERASQAAQARLSAHVLTLIPLAMLAVLLVADDGARSAVTSPVGTSCVLAGAALNVAGWWWMRHIIGPV